MFQSLEEILQACSEKKKLFWEVVLEDDCKEEGITREESLEKMHLTWIPTAPTIRDCFQPAAFPAGTPQKWMPGESGEQRSAVIS